MRVDVWVDVVCPWCYLAKRRLARALDQFPYAAEVRVVWRSFQLDPAYPRRSPTPVHDHLAEKFGTTPERAREMTDHVRSLGAREGLEFHAERAWMVNTVDAHRLAHLAGEHGLLDAMYERLMRAHHVEGEVVDDPRTLSRLAAEVGLPAEPVRRLLSGDAHAAEVAADLAQAREWGITGVPFFVLAGRYGLSGAQPAEALLAALHTAHGQASAPTR